MVFNPYKDDNSDSEDDLYEKLHVNFGGEGGQVVTAHDRQLIDEKIIKQLRDYLAEEKEKEIAHEAYKDFVKENMLGLFMYTEEI